MADGAHALIRTLLDSGVDTCFTNPGTSELQIVAALDAMPEMRAFLTLFEGVATGAADGYARMSGIPAVTLLHLGPGLGNGLANLHNARRSKVPVVNVVGDHPRDHVRRDPPLSSDIETIARNFSAWIRTSACTADVAADVAEAVSVATGPPPQVATLIVPADVAWQDGAQPCPPRRPAERRAAPLEVLQAAADAIRDGRCTAMLLGGRTLWGSGLIAAGRIAATTGIKLFAEFSAGRLERGAGLPPVQRLAYWPEHVSRQLGELSGLILADAAVPVPYFAYPGATDLLIPADCEVHTLSPPPSDAVASIEALADLLDAADAAPAAQACSRPPLPRGQLTGERVCQVVAALMPEGAIVSEEAISSGAEFGRLTAGAPLHDWLPLSGGAIGQGLPVAVGAAVACPDRPVIALQADGSALYTIQSLWTMAREQLDVTVIVFSNRAYGILQTELARNRMHVSDRTARLLELEDPVIDFAGIGSALGVPSRRVDTAEQLDVELRRALAEPGPHLLEAIVPVA